MTLQMCESKEDFIKRFDEEKAELPEGLISIHFIEKLPTIAILKTTTKGKKRKKRKISRKSRARNRRR